MFGASLPILRLFRAHECQSAEGDRTRGLTQSITDRISMGARSSNWRDIVITDETDKGAI